MSSFLSSFLASAPPSITSSPYVDPTRWLSFDFVQICGLVFLFSLLHRYVFPIISFLLSNFLPSNNPKRYGEWAIVTGCTDGIGKAFAWSLAKRGMNLVLISRSEDKLKEMSKTLQSTFPNVSTRSLAIDFNHFDVAARFQVSATIEKLDVGVLINNVGQSYEFPQYFHELTQENVQSLIDLNVVSVSHMTHIVVKKMVEKRKGAIVNISSFAALVESGLLAEYGAAKQYMDTLTENLSLEYAPKGIHFQTQHPLFVTTKLAKLKKSSLLIPTPERYVSAAMKSLGRGVSVTPYWGHAIQQGLLLSLPKFVQRWYIMNTHFSIRKRGMKKRQEAEKQK